MSGIISTLVREKEAVPQKCQLGAKAIRRSSRSLTMASRAHGFSGNRINGTINPPRLTNIDNRSATRTAVKHGERETIIVQFDRLSCARDRRRSD